MRQKAMAPRAYRPRDRKMRKSPLTMRGFCGGPARVAQILALLVFPALWISAAGAVAGDASVSDAEYLIQVDGRFAVVTAKYSSATFFQNVGIPTFVDEIHGLAHNKVMVIDERTVITGSFNFTKAAEESNAENLLVIRDAELAAKYAKNWQEHLEHSVPYERKAKG
jgi:hypothetical protein